MTEKKRASQTTGCIYKLSTFSFLAFAGFVAFLLVLAGVLLFFPLGL